MEQDEIAAALARIAVSLEARGAPGADVAALLDHVTTELNAIHGLAGQLAEVAHEQRAQLAAVRVALDHYGSASAEERMAVNLLLVSIAEMTRKQVRAQEDLARAVGQRALGEAEKQGQV